MVDLDSHQTIDLLPSRNEDVVAAWLRKFPNLELVVRDGAKFFSNAIAKANANIIQVSDRFHYIKTTAHHFRKAIIQALPTRVLTQNVKDESTSGGSVVSKTTSDSWKRKQILISKVIKASHRYSVAKIGRLFSLDPRTVKKYLKGSVYPRQTRTVNQALLPFAPELRHLNKLGYSNRFIYDRLVAQGYPRAFRTFRQYKGQFLNKGFAATVSTGITRRSVANLIFRRYQSCKWTKVLRAILQRFPTVRTILSLFFDFVILSENYNLSGLDTWLKTAQALNNAEIDKACAAIRRDYPAIQNSIIFREYTNGPVEGKNTKTKFIKRTMFGRSHFDTLRTKILLLNRL